MPIVALPKNDRFVQRGPAQPVDVVRIDALTKQPTNDHRVASLGRPDGPRAVVTVERPHIGPMFERQGEQFTVPLARRDQEGTLLSRVLRVNVGPLGDELSGTFHIVVPGSRDQLGIEFTLALAHTFTGDSGELEKWVHRLDHLGIEHGRIKDAAAAAAGAHAVVPCTLRTRTCPPDTLHDARVAMIGTLASPLLLIEFHPIGIGPNCSTSTMTSAGMPSLSAASRRASAFAASYRQ